MEVKITISDGGVTTEQTVARPISGPSASAAQPSAPPDTPEASRNAISAAMASGAMNAGPAPAGLSALGMEGPMPFVGGGQQIPGTPGQSGPGRAPDQSAGPAPTAEASSR
jgi:hypothetical protein